METEAEATADLPAKDAQVIPHQDDPVKAAAEKTKAAPKKLTKATKSTKTTTAKMTPATTGQSAASGKALDRTSVKEPRMDSRTDSDVATQPCP